MDPTTDAVARLLTARRNGVAQPAPLLADAAAAYAVQDAVAASMGWFGGAFPQHWKSGGAARTAVLTHAPLPPAGIFTSPADLSHLPARWRGIEAEIALRLGEPVDAVRAANDGLVTIDAMCVAIEIVESRWTAGMDAPALAKLADLQSHGALVLGDWVPFTARNWLAQRLQVQMGETVRTFEGSHALGGPTWGLRAWLRHATRQGAVVPAGTVVTTGTWCGLLAAPDGQTVHVVFDGLGEASARLS